MNIKPSTKVKPKRKYKTKKEKERKQKAKRQDVTQMGETMLERQLSQGEQDSLKEIIEEAIKKPLHKIKIKDKRGAKSSKCSILKDK
jgi:hypothetical protein